MGTDPLWWDPATPRSYAAQQDPLLAHVSGVPTSADVVIVGAGFTGLWTAHYLLSAAPSLDVVVLEAEHVGFGASGRNGGWVSALWPVGPETLARRSGRTATLAMLAALRDTVDEVGRAADSLGIDCGFRKGGALVLARTAAQARRARAEVMLSQEWGTGTRWLGAAETREHLAATQLHGATFNPHCARVHPRRLVDGLARGVTRQGARIHQGVRVARIEPGRVTTTQGQVVEARHVLRGTEAWTAALPTERRTVAPVYSLVVATEPLSAPMWDAIGLRDGEVFSEHRHVITYGQRTVDGRLVFGGRGAPYHFGSRITPAQDHDDRVFTGLRHALRDLLPQLGDVGFTHAWGGPLGIARDWHPSVGYDAGTGLGWAGGYVGDGVAATNLAGRTLTDLVLGRRTPLTELPWVGHRSPRWEPEPLRWLGINAGLLLANAADREESITRRPAVLGRALSALTGH
ncbi:FAD-dependent oxidoreductase [Knoellia locipacati]|uniref:FAD-dependent oxidoreductase n=1 Tax=Knoellia locipacati TaxID=882824 RepID=A0A512SVR8_9MICO|nr:FAD-dependent oxidoreductase [Knoellia locipacati]GEQ12053.1 FAD-dependent oxidoreductase [Knoellia locipacati]